MSSDFLSGFSSFSINGKHKCYVRYDVNGDICEALCLKCLGKTNRSPIYNTKYVYPLCAECLVDILHLDNNDKKGIKMKSKSKKNDIANTTVDWEAFEKMMTEGSAKLVKLAESYNIYPADLKQEIIKKYGNQISFKKGRNGGIVWSTTVMK